MLRRKEKLVRGETGGDERSYIMQELLGDGVDFTFYFKSRWGQGISILSRKGQDLFIFER